MNRISVIAIHVQWPKSDFVLCGPFNTFNSMNIICLGGIAGDGGDGDGLQHCQTHSKGVEMKAFRNHC